MAGGGSEDSIPKRAISYRLTTVAIISGRNKPVRSPKATWTTCGATSDEPLKLGNVNSVVQMSFYFPFQCTFFPHVDQADQEDQHKHQHLDKSKISACRR